MNDQNYSDDGFVYEYQPAAHVLYVQPSKGPKEGGAFVNVSGVEFASRSAALNYLYCRFNMSAVPAVLVSEIELHCISPQHVSGTVSVEVTLNNQQYTSDGVQYEYEDVSVGSIYPVSGPVFGGTEVELLGVDMHTPDSGDLYCKFGSREAVRAVYEGAHLVTCTSPSYSSASVVSVHIFNNDAVYGSPLAFYYQIDSVVTAIHPLTGVISGGTVLEVHGTDFVDVVTAYCKFALS